MSTGDPVGATERAREEGRIPREIRYDGSAASLFFPGRADDFFPCGAAVSEAALCAEMARIAYVASEEGGRAKDRLRDAVAKAGFAVQDRIDDGGTQGFVADGPSPDGGGPIRVIAFRGTEPTDYMDTAADLDVRPQEWAGGATVHRGFAEALRDVRERVLRAADQAPVPVCLTGHSLGAALATLVASLRPSARLYTLGSPRVGDRALARMIAPERHWRYVDFLDVVTRVPPDGFGFGYVHTGPGHFIDEAGAIHDGLPDEEIQRRQAGARGHRPDMADAMGMFLSARLKRAPLVPMRDLTDHAPINYVAALMRLPG